MKQFMTTTSIKTLRMNINMEKQVNIPNSEGGSDLKLVILIC